MLDRLLRDNPVVVATVLATREERQRAIELAKEEEQLRAERAGADEQDFVREAKGDERAQVDAPWALESAVAQAKARAKVTCTGFLVETYTPLEPHVFVPSGSVPYVPR